MSKPSETEYSKGSFPRSFPDDNWRANYEAIFGPKLSPEMQKLVEKANAEYDRGEALDSLGGKPKVCLCSERGGRNSACPQHPTIF